MPDKSNQVEPNNRSLAIIDMRSDVLVRVALLGLGLGIVAWLLTLLLGRFIIGPVFCPEGQVCSDTDVIAGNIALILTGVAGILALVRMGVYRPMLIAIAACATLWNVGGWLSGIVWYEALGWSALIFMVAYIAFTWLVRPRNFVIVIIVLLLLIIGFRFVATL